MKRIIAFITALALMLCAGCSGGSSSETEGSRSVSFKISSCNVLSEQMSLKLSLSPLSDSAPKSVTLTVSESGKKLTETNVAVDGSDNTIDVPFGDRGTKGTVDMELKAISGGKCEGSANIVFRNGLPQLSEDALYLVLKALKNEELAALVIGAGYTEKEKEGAMGGTFEVERLGIPMLNFCDGPFGVRIFPQYSTCYPAPFVLASSWDTELTKKVGTRIGKDCISFGIDVILAPGMNIHRSVLCGRNSEYFSEDPLLTGKMATAYVNGVQSTGTSAVVKHYAANNEEDDRTTVSAAVTERALRDIYLRGFAYVIREAHPNALMTSYNKINDTYTSVNKNLINAARQDFGFNGLIMSDWTAGGSVTDRVLVGNDLTEPGSYDEVQEVLAALKAGRITRSDLLVCAERILRFVLKSNVLNGVTDENFSKDESRAVSLEAAKSGIVLLKNDGMTLPLANSDIALYGYGSYNTAVGIVGSSWVNTNTITRISTGLEGSGKFTLNRYVTDNYAGVEDEIDLNANLITSSASQSDVAVITLRRQKGEGYDLHNVKGEFLLTDNEMSMITRVSAAFHAAGKKVVVILNTPNYIETASWEKYVDAILWCGVPGETVGEAVASVLSGETNPSGKLTASWPVNYTDEPYAPYVGTDAFQSVYYEDVYVGYRYKTTFNKNVKWCFGYGLSYTGFDYSEAKLSADKFDGKDSTVTLSAKITNKGNVSGREAVQFYVSKPYPEGGPVIELCGFAKTALLDAGASETVSCEVTASELESFCEATSSYTVRAGEYKFYVGSSVNDLTEIGKLTVASDIVTLKTDIDLSPKRAPKTIR